MKTFKILIIALSGLIITISSFAAVRTGGITSERLERHKARITIPISGELPDLSNYAPVFKSGEAGDIAISETVSPAAFDQGFSSIARLSEDRLVMVWQDKRFGSYKIFAGMYDSSGNEISANHFLAGRDDGFNLIEPCAVADGAGGFYAAWRDEASGRIYAARYDASYSQIVAPFVVNDTPAQNYAGPFDIGNFGDSRLAVVWEDYGNGNNIKLRLFNSAGVALTDPVQINSDASSVSHWVPAVAFDETGRMGVVWEDYRFDNGDIYFQLVNVDGSLSGPNLGIVEAAFDDSAQFAPDIAYSVRDGFAVSWLDRRDGVQKVYLQRYVSGTGLVGSNLAVSAGDSTVTVWDIASEVDDSDNLHLAWSSSSEIDSIRIQNFTAGFVPGGAAGVVNRFNSGARWQTALNSIVSGKMLCGWTDFRDGHGDIYVQLLSAAGTPLFAEDKLVNDDDAGAESTEPDVAVLPDGDILTVFTDKRHDAGDIFMQLVGSEGARIGVNEKVNNDPAEALQNEPAVSMSSSGGMIVWNDSRAVLGVTGQRIFGRYVTYAGLFDGADFLISDSLNIDIKREPVTVMADNGAVMVAWVDYRNGTGDIYGRHYNPDGSASGDLFMISSPPGEIDNDDISIDVDNDGDFTVVWLSRGAAGGATVVVSKYANDGQFLNRFTYPSDVTNVEILDITAAVNAAGVVYLVWEGQDVITKLYMTIFADDGGIILPGTHMFSAVSDYAFMPDMDIDAAGHIITTWVEGGSIDRQLFYQVHNSNLSSTGKRWVTATTPEFMMSPSVSASGTTAWFGWVDPRSGGLNVYLAGNDYVAVDIEDEANVQLPEKFDLYQNYPNPFNPETKINFNVPSRVRVEILVYNTLGQVVATLADRMYEAGRHRLVWDGTDSDGYRVSSGIYLYKMTAGDMTIARKMLLLK